ncbi:MAG: hypothetical protein RLZ72_435 [Actinomycetota bacterium]
MAFAMLGGYAVITMALPRFGASLALVSHYPRTTIGLWLGALVLAITSLTTSLGILIAGSLSTTNALGIGEPWQAAVAQHAFGWIALACTGVIIFHLGAAAQWLRAERAEFARQAASVIAHSTRSTLGDDVRVVTLSRHLVSAFPQTGTVLVSDYSVRELSAGEIRSAIEHERAHLAGHHNVVVLLTQVAMAAAAGVDASREFSRTVKLAVEFAADDQVCRTGAKSGLSRAIAAIAAENDPLAELRLSRLRN